MQRRRRRAAADQRRSCTRSASLSTRPDTAGSGTVGGSAAWGAITARWRPRSCCSLTGPSSLPPSPRPNARPPGAATPRAPCAPRAACGRRAGSASSAARSRLRCADVRGRCVGGPPSAAARSPAIASACSPRGGEPVSAKPIAAASCHASDRGVARPPLATSGARKSGVPSTEPASVSVASPVRRAIPKSIKCAWPSASTTMLPGFTSRCSTPRWCAASRASAMLAHTRAAATSSSVPCARTSSLSDEPRTYSMTITMPSSSASPGSLSAGTRSWICTQCGWRTAASARASRRIRSSVSASRTCAALSATVCPELRVVREPYPAESAGAQATHQPEAGVGHAQGPVRDGRRDGTRPGQRVAPPARPGWEGWGDERCRRPGRPGCRANAVAQRGEGVRPRRHHRLGGRVRRSAPRAARPTRAVRLRVARGRCRRCGSRGGPTTGRAGTLRWAAAGRSLHGPRPTAVRPTRSRRGITGGRPGRRAQPEVRRRPGRDVRGEHRHRQQRQPERANRPAGPAAERQPRRGRRQQRRDRRHPDQRQQSQPRAPGVSYCKRLRDRPLAEIAALRADDAHGSVHAAQLPDGSARSPAHPPPRRRTPGRWLEHEQRRQPAGQEARPDEQQRLGRPVA